MTGVWVLLNRLFRSVYGICVLGLEYVVPMIRFPCCVCILADMK